MGHVNRTLAKWAANPSRSSGRPLQSQAIRPFGRFRLEERWWPFRARKRCQEEVPPEKLKVAELRSAIAPENGSRGDRRRLPRGIEGSQGEVFEAICWADVLGLAVSGLGWTHVSQGSLVPRAGSQAVFKSRLRSAVYPPTKGSGGGKQPMGKGASRWPARSFSAALR
jgi:hypothetical protein